MKNKRLFSLLLSIVILLSAIPFAGSTVLAETPNYDDPTKEEGGNEAAYTAYMEQEGRLANFYSKLSALKDGDSLNVAYLGGSITNGSGASDKDVTSWRGLVGEHITNIVKEMNPGTAVENRVLYPMNHDEYDAEPTNGILIKNINAAFGATASYFGIHRAYEDIGLDNAPPDVVFLEFTFNDAGAGDSISRTYKDENGNEVIAPAVEYEAIIRQIYKYAPDCEIIALFTTGSAYLNRIDHEGYPILSAERAVLRHYNIPYLYVGRDLVDELISKDPTVADITANGYASNKTWMQYFIDSVHPTDLGYEGYTDTIINYLNGRFDAAAAAGNTNVENIPNLENKDNIDDVTPFFNDGFTKYIKTSPRNIRMADLFKGHEDLVSGWQEVLPTNNDPGTVSARKGTMISNFVGASFAFRFTGDSLGFWRTGTNEGGKVTAKVYKVEGDTRTLVVESSQVFGGTSDWLPGAWVVSSDLEYATYDVEVSVEGSNYGSKARICRVLWNGEDEITPIEHPDIELVEIYPEIELIKKFVSSTSNVNTNITESDDGSYIMKPVERQTHASLKAIRLVCTATPLSANPAPIGKYKYVFIDYYIDENTTLPYDRFSMLARQTSSMSSISDKYYHSDTLIKGEWQTAVIDLGAYAEFAASAGATPESFWSRLEFCPFSQSASLDTNGISSASVKISSIRLSTTETPSVSEGDDGEQVVYVHKNGTITLPDLSEPVAYTSFADAFNALGRKGGTIYFQGNFDVFKDGTTPHGDVKVIGLGGRDTNILYVTLQASHLIKYGNVTLENLSICYERPSGASEIFMNACGHTLTFGKDVSVITSNGKNIHASSHSTNPVASNFVFSSQDALYSIVSSMAGYGSSASFTGNSNYVFNAGTFASVYGGAYNSSSAAGAHNNGYGDVNYTFNGGTFTNVYTGSVRAGSRHGNVIFTINGGTFTKDIYFGSQLAYNATISNPGSTAIIVNCNEISKTTAGKINSSKINIGKIGSYGGNSATSMVILNNAEKADDVNVQIASGSPANYKIQVLNGKATPVFEKSATTSDSPYVGKPLGFRLESDTPGIVPQINGEKLVPDAQGLYTIPTGDVTINFPQPKSVYVNSTGTVTLPDGTTLEGEAEKVYTGFSAAFDALGLEGGIIYFQGEFSSITDGKNAHGDVEIIGIGDTDELRAQNILTVSGSTSYTFAKGNVTLKNLSIKTTKESYLFPTNGYTLTFGENVVKHANSTYNVSVAPFYALSAARNSATKNVVFSAKDFIYTAVGTSGGYAGSTSKFTGHSNYVFNAGTFNAVYDCYNSEPNGLFEYYGDVNYTFNGGTFSNVSPNSYRSGSRYGNVIYTINGGDFTKDIFFGHYTSSNNTSSVNPGTSAIIVNCKEISQTDSGKLSTTMRNIGTQRDYGGRSATSMVILNNAELASSVNARIATTTPATYKIKVSNGKATPVFEASSTATTSTSAGRLLGFRMESDTEGLVPCANGKRLIPNADGLYTLSTGDVTVTFVKFTEGDANDNGTLNLADLVRVGLYLKQQTTDINTVNADLNIDGFINEEDRNLLRSMLLKALSK